MLKLYDHQKKGLDLALANPRYGFWWQMGAGKTPLGLSIIKCLGRRSLIVTKKNLIESAWLADQKKFFADLGFYNLCGLTPKERGDMIRSPKYGHLITSFESFRQDAAVFTKAVRPVLVIDESSAMRDPQSKISKALLEYGAKAEYCYLLSGLPAPNGPMEFFAQYKLIDPTTFESNFFAFRNRWFQPAKKIWQQGRELTVEWKLNPYKRTAFFDRLGRKGWFLKKEECLDLPDKVFEERKIELPAPLAKVYKQLLDDWVTQVGGDEILAKNKLSELMKLRQVTAGFIYNNDGEVKALEEIPYKTKELLSIMDETDEPVIVSCQFKHEIRTVGKALESAGYKTALFYGDTPTDARDSIVSDFQAGKIRAIVGHPRSFGHGLTLTRSSLIVFHSLSYSLDEHVQTADRIHRIGQTRRCVYIALLAKNSIDEIMWSALQHKETNSEVTAQIVKGILERKKQTVPA